MSSATTADVGISRSDHPVLVEHRPITPISGVRQKDHHMLGFDLGDALWVVIISFFFIMYLMMLFSVIIDLFRDRELSGVWKAVWVIALLAAPLLSLLVYLIVRGKGMAERSMKEQVEAKESFDAYVQNVAGGSGAAAELEKAGALLDAGKITQDEFNALKAKILA
jgi:hypothetical protein